jgi:hypothetical protein
MSGQILPPILSHCRARGRQWAIAANVSPQSPAPRSLGFDLGDRVVRVSKKSREERQLSSLSTTAEHPRRLQFRSVRHAFWSRPVVPWISRLGFSCSFCIPANPVYPHLVTPTEMQRELLKASQHRTKIGEQFKSCCHRMRANRLSELFTPIRCR